MRRVITGIFLSLILPVCVYAKPLNAVLDPIIAHRLPNADVGVVVADAKTGKILYDHRGFHAFTPASNAKLLTTTAALLALGPDFRFKTSAWIKKSALKKGRLTSNVWLKFTGDPSFTVSKLNQLISKLKAHGINTIDGNIVIDDSAFKAPNYAPGWVQDDIAWYYAAPITSVILNQNALVYTLAPSQRLGYNAHLVPESTDQSIKIHDNITTVTEKQADYRCALSINIDRDNTIRATGCWPISNKAKTVGIALRDPNRYAMSVIHQALKANHITLTGRIVTGKLPKQANRIAVIKSWPLKDLIKTILKDSNNIYTESLTKTLGATQYGQGNFTSGAQAIKNILKRRAGLNTQQLYLTDGSGLSRYDLVSPRDLVRLLYVIDHNQKLSALIKPALPNAGEDGTLAWRMQAFDTAGHIKAKTGSMRGIVALSGYLTTQHKQELIFSLIVNHIVGSSDEAKAIETDILTPLYSINLQQ